MELHRLKGKHIFITGAGKRIGRCIAERLLPYQIKLTAHCHHSLTETEELVATAAATGSQAGLVQADLKLVPEIKKAVETAVARFGPVDVLINSASCFYPTPALECTEAQWDELFDTNAKGQYFFAQAVGKEMAQRGGVIINIVDVHAQKPTRTYSAYCASKAALWMVTRSLAREWAPKVRVNSVSPGAVLLPTHYTEEQKARSIERTLLKRLGSAEDIANGVEFLISNEYITGFDLKIDGGRDLI